VPAVTSVAVIGTGFGGLPAAVRLEQVGLDDLVLFEKIGDVGGVGRDKTDVTVTSVMVAR
jgi:cation diffusion facilitator CzcD-associated flavoprotein CzcO